MAKDKKQGQSKYRIRFQVRENLAKWLRSRGIGAYGESNEKGKRKPLPMPMLQTLKADYEVKQLQARTEATADLKD